MHPYIIIQHVIFNKQIIIQHITFNQNNYIYNIEHIRNMVHKLHLPMNSYTTYGIQQIIIQHITYKEVDFLLF
jgi:hypothetical protein